MPEKESLEMSSENRHRGFGCDSVGADCFNYRQQQEGRSIYRRWTAKS